MLKCVSQYVYVPTATPKFQVQEVSYSHADPKTFQNPNQLQGEGPPAMLPTTSRFTPAVGSKAQFPNKRAMGQTFPRQTNMGPPPTPQRLRAHKSNTSDNLLAKKSTNQLLPPPSRRLQNTDKAIPSTSYQQPPNTASQRFFPTASTSNPRGSNSRPSVPNAVRGEHRMPFVPEGAQ